MLLLCLFFCCCCRRRATDFYYFLRYFFVDKIKTKKILYSTDVACKMSQSRETLYSYLSIRVPDQSHVASAAQLEIINQIVNKQRFSECAFSINIVFPCYLLTRSFTYSLTAWNESLSHSLLFTCFLCCICYMLCPNIPNIYLSYYMLLVIVVVLFLYYFPLWKFVARPLLIIKRRRVAIKQTIREQWR